MPPASDSSGSHEPEVPPASDSSGSHEPGEVSSPSPRVDEDQPASTESRLWPGIQIGGSVYALVEAAEGSGPPTDDAQTLGHVIREGAEEPMEFFASLDGAQRPLPDVTVVTMDAAACVARPRRRLRLTSVCPDPHQGEWFQRWIALEVDCQTRSPESVVMEGSHPTATLSSADLEELAVTFHDVLLDRFGRELEPPDFGVSLHGRLIGVVPDSTSQAGARILRAGRISYLILVRGQHGYGRVALALVPEPPHTSSTFWYPAITCGAF